MFSSFSAGVFCLIFEQLFVSRRQTFRVRVSAAGGKQMINGKDWCWLSGKIIKNTQEITLKESMHSRKN